MVATWRRLHPDLLIGGVFNIPTRTYGSHHGGPVTGDLLVNGMHSLPGRYGGVFAHHYRAGRHF